VLGLFFGFFGPAVAGKAAWRTKLLAGVDLPDNFTLQLWASRQKAFVFSVVPLRNGSNGDLGRKAGRSKVGCDGQTPSSALSL
jgi:hypothetical protein